MHVLKVKNQNQVISSWKESKPYWKKPLRDQANLSPYRDSELSNTCVFFSLSISYQRLTGYYFKVSWRSKNRRYPPQKQQRLTRCHQFLCQEGTRCKMGPEKLQQKYQRRGSNSLQVTSSIYLKRREGLEKPGPLNSCSLVFLYPGFGVIFLTTALQTLSGQDLAQSKGLLVRSLTPPKYCSSGTH